MLDMLYKMVVLEMGEVAIFTLPSPNILHTKVNNLRSSQVSLPKIGV